MPRLFRIRLKDKFFFYLLALAGSWIIAPIVILVDLYKGWDIQSRRDQTIFLIMLWFTICGAATFWLWHNMKQGQQPDLQFPVFLGAPASWFLLRLMIDKKAAPISGPEFFLLRRWQDLRYQTLRKYGRVCMCCGAKNKPMHVDHIKPRSKYPKLAYDPSNLQVLCEDCNKGKSNKYEDDFRKAR